MHPLLFKIGPIPIHTYGFMIAMGFLIATQMIKKLSKQSSIDEERMLDLTFWCLLTGFLGSRTLFILTRLPFFMSDPWAIFRVWEGGLVFLGGLVLTIPFVAWYVRRFQLPLWVALDILAPALVLAHAFGRIGCLFAGCCYGKPSGSSFGIKLYSDVVERAYQGIPLHPTQIYESSALFVIFFLLLALFKRKKFDGQVALTYALVYPIVRSVIEMFRGDLVRGFVIEGLLSTSQFISLLLFISALVALRFRMRKVQEQG